MACGEVPRKYSLRVFTMEQGYLRVPCRWEFRVKIYFAKNGFRWPFSDLNVIKLELCNYVESNRVCEVCNLFSFCYRPFRFFLYSSILPLVFSGYVKTVLIWTKYSHNLKITPLHSEWQSQCELLPDIDILFYRVWVLSLDEISEILRCAVWNMKYTSVTKEHILCCRSLESHTRGTTSSQMSSHQKRTCQLCPLALRCLDLRLPSNSLRTKTM